MPALAPELAFGVPALKRTLADVEAAEDAVREILRVRPEENMRVRVLSAPRRRDGARSETSPLLRASAARFASSSNNRKPAALELDPHHLRLVEADASLREGAVRALARCGLVVVRTRAFASGSVAKLPPRRKEKAR